MPGRPSAGESVQHRDIGDVVWQISEKRSCDEIAIRYDCGHDLRADIWAPSLPKTREYGFAEAERGRYARHCIFVLTRDPGSTSMQISIPEGRCRHCGRGQRQMLICGPLQMNLTDAAIATRRLDLPLSGHAFLAAIGQVCRLPGGVPPPSLTPRAGCVLKIFDGTPLPHDGFRQWTRKEVEDAIGRSIIRSMCGAMLFLMLLPIVVANFLPLRVDSSSAPKGNITHPGAGDDADVGAASWGIAAFASAMLARLLAAVGLTWSSGSGADGGKAAGDGMPWTSYLNPWWIGQVAMHTCMWFMLNLGRLALTSISVIIDCFFVQPTLVLSQLPVTNPMIAASMLSVIVAALSAPQTPSLSLVGFWSDILPSLEISRALRRAASYSSTLEALLSRIFGSPSGRKEGRPKSSAKGAAGGGAAATAGRGAKDGSGGAGGKDRGSEKAERRGERGGSASAADAAGGGRTEKAQAGRTTSQGGGASSPPCFICLDRPSHYVLEPCGHRVACGECAVQLVEAAARSRSADAGSGMYADRCGGGTCPCCGMGIMRAMRLFS